MKKLFITLTALAAVLASCSKEAEQQAPETEDVKGPVTLNVILPETKTALGEKQGDPWPNYWSEGDKISVNGVTSEPLDAAGAGKATASFTVDGIAAPFYAAYPAASLSAYDAGNATITIPAAQSYVAGSYDPAAYVMLASGSETTLTFSSKVAIFKLTPTGEKSIKKIVLSSIGSDKIAGAFSTDFSAITPAAGALTSLAVTADSPVPAGTPWFIVVPAVDYSVNGLRVRIEDAEGGSMTCSAKPDKAWAAGKMYSEEIPYAPVASDFTISAEGITSSTAVICLPDASYAAAALTFNVYSDAACSNLVNSFAVPEGDSCWGGAAPRFCISGLAPGVTYFVKVSNDTAHTESNSLSVTTAAFNIVEVSSNPAAVGDVILAEDFGELRWDSELITRGVGYFATSQDSFSNSDVLSFLPIDTNSEKLLSAQGDALASSRLAHWAQGAKANLYIHPGYIKLSASKANITHLVTPALNNIPDGKLATLEVEVTACPYFSESNNAYATFDAVVAVQPAGSYNELTDETKTNTLDLTTNMKPITLDAETAWKSYKVTLTGVGKGARLAFGAASSSVSDQKGRMNISDMKVTVTALEEPGITASVKAVSSSTAAFTWTYGGSAADDIAKPYTIALYSDSACSNLVVSFDIPADDECWSSKSPCFVFGGLAPDTDYWFVATDTASSVSSDPVSAHTDPFIVVDATTVSDAAVGDVILAEDFSEIGTGPDEFLGAASFYPASKVLPVVPAGVNPAGSFIKSNSTGDRIFGAGWDLGSSRLSKGWGFFGNSAAYYQNGFLRVATSATTARTHIVTPALAGIPEGKVATIEVTVTACKYESSENDVAVFAEKGITMKSTTELNSSDFRKYTGASLSDGHALEISSIKSWETKSVTINNVDSDTQLIIGSLENISTKNRFYLSDVKVQITALVDDPVFKIKNEETFNEFVSAVAGGNKSLEAAVTQNVTISSASAEAFASIEDYAGTLNGNGKTISGLTKPLFNELKGTVKDLTLNSTLNITADQLDLGILANVLSGTAIGCKSQGSVTFNVAGGVTEEHHIAGLIGKANSGAEMTGCTNEASVTNETSYAGGNENELMVGGVLGTFWGVDFTISDCENTGAVINNGAWNKDVSVGGIIGQAGNSSSLTCTMTVSGCTNSGAITNNGANADATNSVGGVIGWIRFGTYTDNTNTGTVTNTGNAKQNRVGGLIGYLDKKATFDDNSNSGEVSNTGTATDINYVGGLLGRMQTDNTFKNNSNSGTVSNSGDANNYVYMGGIVGYLDKNNGISDAGSSAQYKLTNSGDIVNGGSAKNICIGGLFGRNSSGYFNMTGTSSKYSSNSGNITDNSGPAKSNGGDLSIGGIAGYTTTGIKTQYARNSGDIYVTGDKGSTAINVGGIGGWISNASFNFNNCRNTGDVTVDATTTASIWAAGIVACPKVNTTNHYYWRSNATIDTHLATVGGENYTAGLMATVEGSDASSTFTMTGHRLAGTVWGSKTTTGLFCCTKNNTASFSIKKGDENNPNMIAPGTVRKDNTHNDTINDITDVTIGVLAGGAGSTYDITSVIDDEHLVVKDW